MKFLTLNGLENNLRSYTDQVIKPLLNKIPTTILKICWAKQPISVVQTFLISKYSSSPTNSPITKKTEPFKSGKNLPYTILQNIWLCRKTTSKPQFIHQQKLYCLLYIFQKYKMKFTTSTNTRAIMSKEMTF